MLMFLFGGIRARYAELLRGTELRKLMDYLEKRELVDIIGILTADSIIVEYTGLLGKKMRPWIRLCCWLRHVKTPL